MGAISSLLQKWHRLFTKYIRFSYTCIACVSGFGVIWGADFKYIMMVVLLVKKDFFLRFWRHDLATLDRKVRPSFIDFMF